jgi:hypothetical protein
MDNKLKRQREKAALGIAFPEGEDSFQGERVFARLSYDTENKARGLKSGIEAFKEAHPKYGTILQEMIDEQRKLSETHLYFGLQEGKHLSSEDYLGVMQNLGFSEHAARRVYPDLMEASRKIARNRGYADRSILVG